MPDVFISYSRKDKAFVQQLHDALETHNRTSWVDWEGIPLSADWWAEIQAAIEASDTFVFIISPDSVVSEVCLKEIGSAVTLNKRIIPLLHREVDAKAVPPDVSSLNWIFFRDSDDFHAAVAQLIDTMDTDLDWLKAHTRLTVRAMEWEKRSRNDSFLLRGDDLAEAEQLLMQTGKQPALTDLQVWYVMSSRQSATKRQRIVIGAVTLGLVIAIILAVIAFINFLYAQKQSQLAQLARETAESSAATAWQAVEAADVARDQAQVARETAEANEKLAWHAVATAETGERIAAVAQRTAVAEQHRAATAEAKAYGLYDQALADRAILYSRKLAADAVRNLDQDPELGILLALRALNLTYTPEAEDALRQALYTADGVTRLQNMNVEELKTQAQNQVARQLTSAECQVYLPQEPCP